MWFQLGLGLSLFLIGIKHLSSQSRQLAVGYGFSIRRLLSTKGVNALVGVLLGTVVQSQQAATALVTGSLSEGLLSQSQAMWLIGGANIGISSLLLIGSIETAHLPEMLLIGLAILLLSGYSTHPKIRLWYQSSLGLALVLLGLGVLKASVLALSQVPHFQSFIVFIEDSPTVAALCGVVLAIVIQSSTTITLLCIPFVSAVHWSWLVTSGMIVGACLGSSMLIYLASNEYDAQATRVALSQLIIRIMTAVILLSTVTSPFLSIGFRDIFETIDSPLWPITIYVLFQVLSLLLWWILENQVTHLVAKWIPLNSMETQRFHFSVGLLAYRDPMVICDQLAFSIFQLLNLLRSAVAINDGDTASSSPPFAQNRHKLNDVKAEIDRCQRTVQIVKSWNLEGSQVRFVLLVDRVNRLSELHAALDAWDAAVIACGAVRLESLLRIITGVPRLLSQIALMWDSGNELNVVNELNELNGSALREVCVSISQFKKELSGATHTTDDLPALMKCLSESERIVTLYNVIVHSMATKM